ncbi:cupin domain-containing protein [Curvivirga sp.]|uniref:cupin domain-containing protein n=1 Tax=Curvivirga sp. TaxID=2856848 RepID=UPI003B5C7BCC
MQINHDLTQRVVLNTDEIEWVKTRMNGVERRMLDRDGAESGRATSIVKFAPDSYFEEHGHPGGEEFLVLEGVFSDETGDYGPGMYIRNPIGSKHKPYTKDGCTILVKLWQMEEEDQDWVKKDTKKSEWLPGLVSGLQVMPLHNYKTENVALVKWDAGTVFNPHKHWGGEEIYVLDGTFEDEHGSYPKGTWIRSPDGSSHHPFTKEGCTIFVKTGHLIQN